MILKIPYGDGAIKFFLPKTGLLGILEGKHPRSITISKMLAKSLDNPLDSGRIERLAAGRRKILIVVTDATRKAHLKEILPELLKRISGNDRIIDIIIATGLHKKHTVAHLKKLLGEQVFSKYRVINHEQNKRSLANLGYSKNGVPIILNKNLFKHDFIVSVGVIEPHLYAGYSGGVKTVAIGLAGEDTINATHSIKFLDDPGTRLGSISGNKFQKTLQEIAGRTDLEFSVNVVNDPEGNAVAVFSGDTASVFAEGIKFSKDVFEVSAKDAADIVICGVGYPKDVNLYQASRAVNYILNVDRPVLKKNGVLIVAAELRDGIGEGLSEKRFYSELAGMKSPDSFIKKIKHSGCIAGVHRAYMVAKPMLNYRIIFVTKGGKGFMKDLPFPSFEEMSGAVKYALRIMGRDSKFYIVPRALSTIVRREV